MCAWFTCWLQLMLLLQQQTRRQTRHGAAGGRCPVGADSLVALIHVGAFIAFIHEARDDLRLPSACRNPNAAPAVPAAHCVSMFVTWHNTRLSNHCAAHVLTHAARCVPLTPRHQASRCIGRRLGGVSQSAHCRARQRTCRSCSIHACCFCSAAYPASCSILTSTRD